MKNSDVDSTFTKNIEAFDSTHYFDLEKAYKNNDTVLLHKFFENWSHESKSFKHESNDALTQNIERIFTEVYHPFNVEKYGWLARKIDKKIRYAILPTEIKYKIIDEIKNPDTIYKLKLDTLRQFHPKPEIGNAVRLYDIEPFRTSMSIYLRADSYKKTRFLNTFIKTPISRNWRKYQTSPEIIGLLMNRELNRAVVDIRLISTGLRIHLGLVKGVWKTRKIEQLWEE